jgi:hypothetical protein
MSGSNSRCRPLLTVKRLDNTRTPGSAARSRTCRSTIYIPFSEHGIIPGVKQPPSRLREGISLVSRCGEAGPARCKLGKDWLEPRPGHSSETKTHTFVCCATRLQANTQQMHPVSCVSLHWSCSIACFLAAASRSGFAKNRNNYTCK